MSSPHDPRPSGPAINDDPGKDNQVIVGLSASLRLLDEFSRDGGTPRQVEDLAAGIGQPAAMVAAAARVLVTEGVLEWVVPDRSLRLGGGALALGLTALAGASIQRAALPRMRKLASDTRFNVGLGTRDRRRMVYIQACESEALVGLRLFAGSRIPIMTSAMGRAYLAALAEADRKALLDELRPSQPEGWAELVAGVERAVRDLTVRGFCVSAGDWQAEIHGVAAPIRRPDGQIFVVNLGGPAYLMPVETLLTTYGPLVAGLARDVEIDCFVGSGYEPASRWSRQTSSSD